MQPGCAGDVQAVEDLVPHGAECSCPYSVRRRVSSRPYVAQQRLPGRVDRRGTRPGGPTPSLPDGRQYMHDNDTVRMELSHTYRMQLLD
jgi:hypothetical protein